MFFQGSPALFVGFLLLWGVSVIADSPMFSALVTQPAPAQGRGTAFA
jgi:hypothetical protein